MPEAKVKCPICGREMQKKQVPPGLIIDYCDEHGVWLDAGELEAIVQAIEKENHQAPAAGQAPTSGGGDSMLKDAGKQLGRSALFGVGASVGHRLVGGIIDGLFRK